MRMIVNEVLENRMRGWDDVGNFDQLVGEGARAGGGQQFFASLLTERKRFIVRC